MSELKIRLLGPPVVELDETLVEVKPRKALAVLIYLACAGPRQARDTLATLLWPETGQSKARASLRRRLSELDQTLGGTWLYTDRENATLVDSPGLQIDVADFEAHLAACTTHGHGPGEVCALCREPLAAAVALYEDDFLTGFTLSDCPEFDDWQFFKAESLRLQLAGTLQKLVTLHNQSGDYEPAIPYARRWLSLDPLHEPAHRELMRLYARTEQQSAALRQYQLCVQTLDDEMGVDPSDETMALHERIRLGKFGTSALNRREVAASSVPLDKPTSHRDWGEAPDVSQFYGRKAEMNQLAGWLIDERCRLVGVLGMGGIGKTALVTQLAEQVQGQFDYLIWRSLRNARPLDEILADWILFLSDQQTYDLPVELDTRLSLLVDILSQKRCLLVLDNVEAILQAGPKAGHFRSGYEAYGLLIERVSESRHQSCLILTSREKPRTLTPLEGESTPVRTLQLLNLDTQAGRAMLQDRGLEGSDQAWSNLIDQYSGNPLALKLVAETVGDLFDGSIEAFLKEEVIIFGEVRAMLNQHFDRLSALEQDLMIWLAIEREPTEIDHLIQDFVHPPTRSELLEALRAMRRRSLLETVGPKFTQQNVVMEYVTDRLIDSFCQEIEAEDTSAQASLNRFALMKAQAKDYVRESQLRLLLQPVADRLQTMLGPQQLDSKLRALLTRLRQEASGRPGYAAGNILNLFLHLGYDQAGLDFTGLAVWQAYLQGITLHDMDFSSADLAGSLFTDAFGGIQSIAVSPDGMHMAAGASDGQIRYWRIADSQLLLTFEGHTSWVLCVCFSPDGKTLAGSSSDGTVRLWDVRSGQTRKTLRGHTDWTRGLHFSPDSAILASGSVDQTVRLWDVQSGKNLRTFSGFGSGVWPVRISPDGATLVSGGHDGIVRLWEIHSGQMVKTLPGHTGGIWSFCFSPDGATLASGGNDGVVRLWDVNSGQPLKTLQGHTDWIRSVYFSPDGTILASGSEDQTVRLWDVHSGQTLKILQGHTNKVTSIGISPDGAIVASGSDDETVRLWDVQSGQPLKTLQGYINRVGSVCFSPDGSILASGSTDHIVRLWDVAAALGSSSDQIPKALHGHTNDVKDLDLSPDGTILASGCTDNTVRLWDTRSGQLLRVLRGHPSDVHFVCFSPDGAILASGSDDGSLRLWEVRTGRVLAAVPAYVGFQSDLCFSPDGAIIASGGDQTVHLWDVAHLVASNNAGALAVAERPDAGQMFVFVPENTGRVSSIYFSPDGNMLTVVCSGGSVHSWNIGYAQALNNTDVQSSHQTFNISTEYINAACFSPDGAILATAGRDIHLWDTRSGNMLRTLQGHTSVIETACFSPTGPFLASGSEDGTVKLWDIHSGKCLRTLRPDRPYERMNITGVTGLTPARIAVLKVLGAVEDPS